MKQRTDNYIFTADPMSVNDMQQIAIVRRTVAVGNKLKMRTYMQQCRIAYYSDQDQPLPPTLHRVSLKGRLGKNNPAAAKYKGRFQSIPLVDAQRIDVYIHERR